MTCTINHMLIERGVQARELGHSVMEGIKMDIHLLSPNQTCSCKAYHVCQSCQGQDTVNAKLLAALEAADELWSWLPFDSGEDIQKVARKVARLQHAAIEEANK